MFMLTTNKENHNGWVFSTRRFDIQVRDAVDDAQVGGSLIISLQVSLFLKEHTFSLLISSGLPRLYVKVKHVKCHAVKPRPPLMLSL